MHNKELHELYFSPDTIEIMKSMTMQLEIHVARMGQKEYAYGFLVRKPEGEGLLRVPS
jgi:hypothetical protein